MTQIRTMPTTDRRQPREETLHADLVVVGGGMGGTCCAIAAARAGARVVLVQDRPVLGGNASSEVRLYINGATYFGTTNNRWAREGGLLDEVLVENTYRNPEGNALLFDTVLLEKAIAEPNLTLLLNTAVDAVDKDGDRIASARAFCSQNQTSYTLRAPLYCDASGDGIVGYLSGAAFRMGAEAKDEFGEAFAPSEEYGALLGQSIYFYTKDVGRPVKFVPPSYALDDITKIPRYRSINTHEQGCQLWWIDYGGRLDTVYDTEEIKWELWSIVYGVWDHLKNSGEFPEAENLTLEWVGLIPGKRESRRFEGLYMLRQQDLQEQREHEDAVAFGGHPLDLHPADGIYSELPGAQCVVLRGIYQIPYRSLVSASVPNLFLGGRLVSASHAAFSSSRVMATCAHMGQAVGMAAALCTREGIEPAALLEPDRMRRLQTELLRCGQHIPRVPLDDPDDLVRHAQISASSEYELRELPADGPAVPLDRSRAQLLPVPAGGLPRVTFTVDVAVATTLRAELRTGREPDDHTPDVMLGRCERHLAAGEGQRVTIEVDARVDEPRYVFVCLMQNDAVSVRTSTERLTGMMGVNHWFTQEAEEAVGAPRLELWAPEREPYGRNLAFAVEGALRPFRPENVRNGWSRPTSHPNAWLASRDDDAPVIGLQWPRPQRIGRLELMFDTDLDRPLESVLIRQTEHIMPLCVRHYRVRAGDQVVAEVADNHQTRSVVTFEPQLEVDELSIEIVEGPAAILDLRCYA